MQSEDDDDATQKPICFVILFIHPSKIQLPRDLMGGGVSAPNL
jgi:hypothetical protein